MAFIQSHGNVRNHHGPSGVYPERRRQPGGKHIGLDSSADTKILSFLGKARNTLSKADLNRVYIKSVLTDLQQKLNNIAQNALSNALVQGRAI